MDMDNAHGRRPRAGGGAVIFWVFFFAGAIVGVAIANTVDDMLTLHFRGHHTDGGAAILSLCGVPLGAAAAILARVCRPGRLLRWYSGLAFGTLSPLIALGFAYLWLR